MSAVYFASVRLKSPGIGLLRKIEFLSKTLPEIIDEGDVVAIKVHIGERGSTRFIRPIFIRKIVEQVHKEGGKPFVTDTTTLYRGSRFEVTGCLEVAREHGFSEDVLGCPFLVADGLRGHDEVEAQKGGINLGKISVAKAIKDADVLMVVTHVKGHDLTGFGGAIKNVGMGCIDKYGKMKVHSVSKPILNNDLCNNCETCVDVCPWNAIMRSERSPTINYRECRGCTSCIYACPGGALTIPKENLLKFQTLLAESASVVLGLFRGKVAFFNFVLDVTPVCDCAPFSDIPIIPDRGILASTDIVAIDKASLDLVDSAPILPDSILQGRTIGKSKFETLHGIDPLLQVKAAERLGLGSMSYKLIDVEEK